MKTKALRRMANEQALASAKLEGHEPTESFLADTEAVANGTMTHDQARTNSLARALRASDDEERGLKRDAA